MKFKKILSMVAPVLLLTSCTNDIIIYTEPEFEKYNNIVTYDDFVNTATEKSKQCKFYEKGYTNSFTLKLNVVSYQESNLKRGGDELEKAEMKGVSNVDFQYDNNNIVSTINTETNVKMKNFEIDSNAKKEVSYVVSSEEKKEYQFATIDDKNYRIEISPLAKTYKKGILSTETFYENMIAVASDLMDVLFEDSYNLKDDGEKTYYIDGDLFTLTYTFNNSEPYKASEYDTNAVGTKTTNIDHKFQFKLLEDSMKLVISSKKTTKTSFKEDRDPYKANDVITNEEKASSTLEFKFEDVTLSKTDYSKLTEEN